MRKLFCLFLVPIVLFFGGCGDDEKSPSAPEDQSFTSIEGKIEGWTVTPNTSLTFSVSSAPFGMYEIGTDGKFKVDLPVPASSFLNNFAETYDYSGITVSDTTVNYTTGAIRVLSGANMTSYIVQSDKKITNVFSITGVGSYVVQYWYFDKDITITGSYSMLSIPLTTKNTYDLKCAKGWNKIVKRVDSESLSQRVYKYENILPSEAKFYAVM